MKAFLNILLLFIALTYTVESVYAFSADSHQMQHSEMNCCDDAKADHSCCDDHEKSENHCSDSNCNCIMISNAPVFTFQKQEKLNLISAFQQANFLLITSDFKSPVFPIWTPPDIA